MSFRFHSEAVVEFKKSVIYYQSIDRQLAHQFVKEVKLTLQHIQQFPEAWTQVGKNLRRCLLNRFPFAVIYRVNKDSIYVLAVMNLNRKPEYWQERL